jgi:hypothetical protein
MTMKKAMLALLIAAAAAPALAAPASSTVNFSNGREGWVGVESADGLSGTVIDSGLGIGAPALHTTVNDTFGLNWGTKTNQAFLGDYTKSPSVTLGVDVLTKSITYEGIEVSRNLVVELRDYDNKPAGQPYTSVWYDLGNISASQAGWQHLSVTISDTSSALLPSGWGGYGGADSAGGPALPHDRSFASVLSGVDEIVFTTFVPGYFYGYTNYDVAVDNVSIAAVPEPASYGMMLGGMGLLGWIARRKQRA